MLTATHCPCRLPDRMNFAVDVVSAPPTCPAGASFELTYADGNWQVNAFENCSISEVADEGVDCFRGVDVVCSQDDFRFLVTLVSGSSTLNVRRVSDRALVCSAMVNQRVLP